MDSIKFLSDSDLELSLKNLVDKERKLLHVIIEHIKEVESRKLYLARAFGSLREYLVTEFGYSGSAADRRIEAAQLLSQVPSMAEMVRDGSINLTQIGQLSSAIKEKERTAGLKITAQEKHDLVECIAGLSGRDTQYELSQVLDIPIKQFEKTQVQADESVRIEITLTKEQFEQLQACRDSLAQALTQERQEISMANVIGKLIGEYVDNKTQQIAKRKPLISSDMTDCKTAAVLERVNKSVTPKTRQLVLAKSSCCVFKDPKTGRQCKSTFAPQTDHIQSRSSGGSHSIKNLQTLCARHNRYKYQQERTVELRFFN